MRTFRVLAYCLAVGSFLSMGGSRDGSGLVPGPCHL